MTTEKETTNWSMVALVAIVLTYILGSAAFELHAIEKCVDRGGTLDKCRAIVDDAGCSLQTRK